MPTYIYYCDNCSQNFEISKPMSLINQQEVCKYCKSSQIYRDYNQETKTINTPKTVGSLADKNDSKFSKDYKQHLSMKK